MKLAPSILLLALLASAGAFARVRPQAPPLSVQKIPLGDPLHSGGDWRLRGPAAFALVRFALPLRSQPAAGSRLHIFLEHPTPLDGDRSFLTVTLNYGVLRSLRLDETDAALTEITVDVPPASIHDNNQLVLSVEQHSPQPAPPLTIISARSYLELHSVRVPMEWTLAALREAAVSSVAYGPERLSVLLPANPSSGTLEALALLVAQFSRRAGQEPPALNLVRDLRRAGGPVLVVGTPSEQPLLVSLAAPPLTLYRGGAHVVVGGSDPQTVNQTDGFLELRSIDRGGESVLLVTGNSPAAVLQAARGLTAPSWRASGNFVPVSQPTAWPPSQPRAWQGFLPARASFQLHDLGEKNVPIAYPDGALISLDATPDAVFLPYAHQVILKLSLAAAYRDPKAEIAVQLNGEEIARFAVGERFRSGAASLPVSIPARLLRGSNLLKISWRGPAPAAAADGTAGWVLGGSEFYLPRDYQAQLPDLSLLKSSFYPFSLRGDFSDVLLIVPARSDASTVAALLDVARAMARVAPSDPLAFRVKRGDDITQEDLSRNHLIVLDPGPPNRLPAELAQALRPLPARVALGRNLRLVREVISPWNSQRYVLLLEAESPAGLSDLAETAFSAERMAGLSGDTAVLEPAGARCFALGPQQSLREVSYNLALQAWLRVHWTALPLVLITVSGGLFVALRLLLRQGSTPRP